MPSYPIDSRGYCDTRNASNYVGLSTAWLEKARHLGNGPDYVRFGTAVRYSYAALDHYAVEQRKSARLNAAERRSTRRNELGAETA